MLPCQHFMVNQPAGDSLQSSSAQTPHQTLHSCSCCACMDAEASDVSQAVRQQPSKSSGKVQQSALRAWQALAAEATYQSASARQLAGMLHSIRTVHSVPTCTM